MFVQESVGGRWRIYFWFVVFWTGVGGIEGDGDIFNPDNQAEFIKFVKDNTEGKGVYFVMADGVGRE